MKELIARSLAKAVSFETYANEVEKSANGDHAMYNDENLDYYTELNHHRMKRLNKKLELNEDVIEAGKAITCDLTWLVLTEGWCGDAAQILPVLHKIEQVMDRVDLKLVYRDQNLQLMDQFLTNGGRSIPKVIVVDNATLEVKGSWGPRPRPAQDMFEVYKSEEPKRDYKEFQVEMQKWYAKDKAEHIQRELLPLFKLCE